MKKISISVVCLILLLGANISPAYAAIGHLKLLLETSYTLDDSFDGISPDDYMIGGGLSLEFDLPVGFSLGLEYNRAKKTGMLFENYYTAYKIHSPRLFLRWRYKVTDWFEPYLLLAGGVDFHDITIKRQNDSVFESTNNAWQPSFGGFAGLQFQLAESWIKDWGVWEGFSLGIYFEGGYIYRKPQNIEVNTKVYVDLEHAKASGVTLGKLNTSGPAFRTGVFWRF